MTAPRIPRLLADRVLIKPAAAEEKAGSIFIPEAAKEKPAEGEVIAVGPGRYENGHAPMTVQTGDTVLYGKYAGTDVTIDGVSYLVVRESDILAVL